MNSLYKDLAYSILRLRIEEAIGDAWKSGNYSKWAPELANAKKASANGAIVFASPWNPPASMQESFTKSGDSDAKRLKYDKYTEYVQYLNAYVKYMKDNGVNLYAISVQNEPDYATDWNWWTPQEMLNFMKNNAGSINCKVMAPESFQYLKNMSDPILNDTTALANMDILGLHLYGTPLSQFSKFIRPGYYRVDATANPKTNVYVSAYKGDNKVTIVAINQGTSAVSQNFVLQNGETSKVSTCVTLLLKQYLLGIITVFPGH